MTDTLVLRLAVAALVGLAVGIEREWSGHGSTGSDPRFAGVRTFLLLGGLGGVAGWLVTDEHEAIAVVLLAGVALLVTAAYWSVARQGSGEAIDGTTEVAAFLVLALGVLAGLGQTAVAGGSAVLIVLALSEKDAIRSAVARLDAAELRAALHFSVLALVVLPVLPARTLGPYGGINLRELWIVVLIFSGLNFAGYIARRLVGASRGYGVTGALGGVLSSTVVSLQFARLSRRNPALATPLAIGTVAASTVLIPRVVAISYVLAPPVAVALLPYLIPPFLAGALLVGVQFVRSQEGPNEDRDAPPERNPLGLVSAIQMALAFQAALMALAFARTRFGSAGVLVSAGILGLTNMDALTLSMTQLGRSGESGAAALAAQAIALGVSANAVLKLAITLLIGASPYRMLAARGLVLLFVVGTATLLIVSR